MKVLKRFHYSLLEVMLVLGLLTSLAGVIGVNVRALITEQKTLDECTKVLNILNIAQELMMILDIDSEVRFKRVNETYICTLIPKSALSVEAEHLIPKNPLRLKEIKGIFFEDAFQNLILKDDFVLTFFSKGFMMNHGNLVFKANALTRVIPFIGHPTPLIFEKHEKSLSSFFLEQQEAILQITTQTANETKKI